MDYRDVVVALTDLTPETKRRALDELMSASADELEGLSLFLARLLSIDSGRTVGVWAVGALVALWREQVEGAVARGDSASDLSWPVIVAVRLRCLPILFELRTMWFGWNEWDDCLIVAPLAAVSRDEWYDAAANVLYVMSKRSTPAAAEALEMIDRWFRIPRSSQERSVSAL